MLTTKKAVAGMDFLQEFVLGLFILIVIAFVVVLAGVSMQETSRDTIGGTTINESGWLNSSSYQVTNRTLQGFTGFSVTEIRNASNQITLGTGNYTFAGNGSIYNVTTAWDDVDIDYTFTYTRNTVATGIITNFTSGIATLGNSVPTWVTLAGLVVLMAIMAVIIIVVKRLKGAEGGGGAGDL